MNYDGKRAKYLIKLGNDYWKRFRSTYLNKLRQRHLYRKGKVNTENKLRLGDVVLIKDDVITPRMMWKIGKVERLVVGKDGYVRGAELTVISNQGKRTTASRPITKLIPFEIVEDDSIPENMIVEVERDLFDNVADNNTILHTNDDASGNTSDVNSNDNFSNKVNNRPKRKAAIAGENLRRLRQVDENLIVD